MNPWQHDSSTTPYRQTQQVQQIQQNQHTQHAQQNQHHQEDGFNPGYYAGGLSYPPYRYLPPVGMLHVNPNRKDISDALPINIEHTNSEAMKHTVACGRCLKLRKDHPADQQPMYRCRDECGYCGGNHEVGSACPFLYATHKWLKLRVRTTDHPELPSYMSICPSEDDEVKLQGLGYIYPGAKYDPEGVPMFTPEAWAMRDHTLPRSQSSTTIHNPASGEMKRPALMGPQGSGSKQRPPRHQQQHRSQQSPHFKEPFPRRDNYRGREDYPRREEYSRRDNYPRRDDYRGREDYPRREEYSRRDDYPRRDDYRGRAEYPRREEYSRRDDYYHSPRLITDWRERSPPQTSSYGRGYRSPPPRAAGPLPPAPRTAYEMQPPGGDRDGFFRGQPPKVKVESDDGVVIKVEELE
ncbi:unnamed protein product [Periconia digitata]|uniref:Uncharacterized protein n=1 Tax=Periconia digitata TaxID=1303443 RepID=A0A9W4US71_9PLEO|nr:unnamed protein product [Periconia digitata]